MQERRFAPDGGVAPPVVGDDGHERSPADADVGAVRRQVLAEGGADVPTLGGRLDSCGGEDGGGDVGIGDEAVIGLAGPGAVGVADQQHEIGHGAGERMALLADEVFVVGIAQVVAVVGGDDDDGFVGAAG